MRIATLPDLIRCAPLVVTKRRRGYVYCHKHGTRIARFWISPDFDFNGWINGVAVHPWNAHVARMRELHRFRPFRTTRMPC